MEYSTWSRNSRWNQQRIILWGHNAHCQKNVLPGPIFAEINRYANSLCTRSKIVVAPWHHVHCARLGFFKVLAQCVIAVVARLTWRLTNCRKEGPLLNSFSNIILKTCSMLRIISSFHIAFKLENAFPSLTQTLANLEKLASIASSPQIYTSVVYNPSRAQGTTKQVRKVKFTSAMMSHFQVLLRFWAGVLEQFGRTQHVAALSTLTQSPGHHGKKVCIALSLELGGCHYTFLFLTFYRILPGNGRLDLPGVL